MVSSLVWFLVYSVPPMFGWWLAFRAPFGRRRFVRTIRIAAPLHDVWAALDPRGADGGWVPLLEAHHARVLREAPLRLSYFRRPRFSDEVYTQAIDLCDVDEDARCIQRIEREVDGTRIPSAIAWKCAYTLDPAGATTVVTLTYERPTTGLLDYEMTRLGLSADLRALNDALCGKNRKAPLFRFSGWRLAFLGLMSALLMIALLLAPAFYLVLGMIGVSLDAVFADRTLALFLLLIALVMILYVTAIFVFATLVHELGHALALAAFGHRGVTIHLLPFGGGVSTSARRAGDAFEAGAVGLAGPAFSALVALALLPHADALRDLLRWAVADAALRATLPTPGLDAFWALTGALTAFFILLINIPNVLPWTGSDGAMALRAIFSGARLRLAGAIALTLLLTFVFARANDLLPFALLFAALTWFNRNRPTREVDGAADGGGRRAIMAMGLALTVGLYVYEANVLRGLGWSGL